MRSLALLLVLTAHVHAEPCGGAIMDDVAKLADPDLDGRAPGSDGDRAARALVKARFECLGLTTSEQAFGDTANVIGILAGEDPDQIVVVGAHHDHLGKGHLGANDNASGVAAMLAIAKTLAGDKPHRTIAFVAFGDEERGEIGSKFLVAHPLEALPLAHIVEYINLDMVGSYSSRGWVAAMGAFASQPARKLLDKIKHPKLDVLAGGRASRSDHEAFCKQGIPYVFFWTPDDRCYHDTCDTADRIDQVHMTKIATLAGELVKQLAATPLDLAASRAKLGCGQPR
jgi:Zn-dependent M28 family amino/carboxypeptidase